VIINKSKIDRILIRATNWVGDVVMTLPALEAVRDCFPDSPISILAKPWVIPLFEAHPMVDEVIPMKIEEGPLAGVKEIMKSSFTIRRKKFDMAILFQNAFEAALMVFLAGIKIRIGYNTDHRAILLSHPVMMNYDLIKEHQTGYYLSILKDFGCEAEPRDPRLFVSDNNMRKARKLLRDEGVKDGDLVVGLSPGAIFGPAKRWPPDRFAQIGDWAIERWNARIIILGSEREKDICDRVSETMNHPSINLCGKTGLGTAMALIKNCDLFLSNDSGLMHVAGALKIPLVAIFGSTNPKATGPGGSGSRSIIVRHDMECAPCLKPFCPKDFRCMLEIGTEEVWNNLENLKRNL
jgi:heptosyltransferase-2